MDKRDETTRAQRGRLSVAMAAAVWAMVSAAAPPAAANSPTAAAEPDPVTEQVWVIDGEVVATRLSSTPSTGYGGHGVDYEPRTSTGCRIDGAAD